MVGGHPPSWGGGVYGALWLLPPRLFGMGAGVGLWVGRGVLGPAQQGSGGTGLAHTPLPSKSLERAPGSPLAQCAHAHGHPLTPSASLHSPTPDTYMGYRELTITPPTTLNCKRGHRGLTLRQQDSPQISLLGNAVGGIQVRPCHWPSPADAGSKQLVMTIISVVRAD